MAFTFVFLQNGPAKIGLFLRTPVSAFTLDAFALDDGKHGCRLLAAHH